MPIPNVDAGLEVRECSWSMSIRDADGRRTMFRTSENRYRVTVYLTRQEIAKRKQVEQIEKRQVELDEQIKRLSIDDDSCRGEVSRFFESCMSMLGPMMLKTNGDGSAWNHKLGGAQLAASFDQAEYDRFYECVRKFRKLIKGAKIARDEKTLRVLRQERLSLEDGAYQGFKQRLGL